MSRIAVITLLAFELVVDGCTGTTPALVQAISTADPATVERLLEQGSDPNTTGPDRRTALMEAAETGRTEVAELLLSRGARVGAVDWGGETALMKAARKGHVAVALLLLRHGADPNRKARGQRPGGFSQLLFDPDIHPGLTSREKLESEDDPRLEGGHTALMWAAEAGHTSLVKVLIAYGADPTLQDWEGDTALSLAREGGHLGTARVLLEWKAQENRERRH